MNRELTILKGKHSLLGVGSLMLLMGPTIFVIVLWQFHSSVSHREMSESLPPVARNLFIGCISTVVHADVWP